MSVNNFDGVAFIYDALSKLFFGRSLKKAQTYFIKNIPTDSTILVLGSGTGWIADEILKHKPKSKITLVDASQRMTNRAIKRLKSKSVEIICGDESTQFREKFDTIILPCFLDMFPDEQIRAVINRIKLNLKANSIWLITDFVSERWWHRIYLWTMYRFFKMTCAIQANQLPDWETILRSNLPSIKESKKVYGGFIKSIISYP